MGPNFTKINSTWIHINMIEMRKTLMITDNNIITLTTNGMMRNPNSTPEERVREFPPNNPTPMTPMTLTT